MKRSIFSYWWNDKPNAAPSVGVATPRDYEAPKPAPVIEQKREWGHSDTEGKGKNCGRYNRPVYTPPNSTPGTCRDYVCDSKEWQSKGLVEREKGSGKILTRDGKKVE